MCDYSLTALQTRLAEEGEELVTYRFPTGTMGLTSPAEIERCKRQVHGWRPWFNPREVPCAVCIPPYARLRLHDIPERLQRQLGVRAVEEVVFIEMNSMPGRHRDGVRFQNNQEASLQQFAEGQCADVLSVSLETEEEVDLPDHSGVSA
jgi:hypothetical protein